MIAEHPSAAEIIKPYLRGQDFERWLAPWGGIFMIFARRGIEINAYPSIKRHFLTYRSQLEPRPLDWKPSHGEEWSGRKPGTYAWHEIQDAVDYWPLMEKPKILYPDIAWTSSFSIDRTGMYPNNTGYFVPGGDPWVAAVLNAPVGWWYAWRRAQHGKDEALRYFNTFVEDYPVPREPAANVASITAEIEHLTSIVSEARQRIDNWLHAEWQIANLPRTLRNTVNLDVDAFVTAVRGTLNGTCKLTASQVAELRREHAATVEPARLVRAEIFNLERKLSDLVNDAYGLTPNEVALMWRTAPPRMPFTPTGLQLRDERIDDDNDAEE